MNKRTALIAAAGALGGAALAAAAVLIIPSLGGDDSGADAQVEQLELAAETAELSDEISELAQGIADGQDTSKRSDDISDEATELAGQASTFDKEDAVAARALERANESNLDSASELESIQGEMEEGRLAIDEEEEASEEASERLASLSSIVEGLVDQVNTAEKRATGAVSELGQGVAALSSELEDSEELSDDAASQLAAVERNLDAVSSDLSEAFESLRAAAASLGGELANRSEELEPDVVLDCPELSATSGAGLFNVSVRNMSCAEAGSLLGQFGPPAGFSCSETASGYESTEYRCTSGDRAIAYGVGA